MEVSCLFWAPLRVKWAMSVNKMLRINANISQDKLPALSQNVPLQTRPQRCYQHDGAPPHFSHFVRQYPNHKFSKRWLGHGGKKSATTVTGSQPITLPCVGLHESYGVRTQGEQENCSSEFSTLQEASTTLQCFVNSQVPWSHES